MYFIVASNQFLNTIKQLKRKIYLPQISFPVDTMVPRIAKHSSLP